MEVIETIQQDHVHEKPDNDGDTMSITHTESFTCNQCMDVFEDRDTLFKHIKVSHQQHVHSRRRFICDQCQKTFKSMSGLRNHSRTHSEYFATSADCINPDADSIVSHNISNTSTVSTNEGSCLQMNSNSKEEIQSDDRDLRNLNDIVTEHTSEVDGTSTNKSESRSRKSFDRCKRRRSGIPLPVRRSLLMDRSLYFEHSKHVDSDNNRTDLTSSINASHKSAIPTCPASKVHIEETQQNSNTPDVNLTQKSVKTKFTITSPFGNRHTALTTPKNTSRSRPQTPKIRTRTPNSGTITPNGGKRTPIGRRKTPNGGRNTPNGGRKTPNGGRKTPKGLKLTPHKNIHSSGKRTPGGSKMDTSNMCGVYNCNKCGKSFADKVKLDVHFVVHVRETPEKCGIPKHSLKKTPINKLTEFPVAENKHEGDTVFSPKLSSRTFDKKYFLKAHVKTHDVRTPFTCDYCDKKFRFSSSLKAHSFVHLGEPNGYTSMLTTKYQNSSSNKHGLQEDSTKTPMQLNLFSIPSIVDNQANHFADIDVPFACKVCDYKTRAPAELLIHMKSHSKSGSYKCRHCFKTYRQQKNLKTHEKVHTINRLKHLLIDNSIISVGTN